MTSSVATHGDRLWPVLTVLVLIVAGAMALEVVATRHELPPIRIVIDGAGSLVGADDDGATEGIDIAPDARGPVDDLHDRARTAARRGELEEALAMFEQVAAAHPESARVHDDFGYWLMVAGRAREAQAQLLEAQALAPDDALVLANLGAVLRRLGRREDAEVHYRRALELQPGLGRARVALASMALERGDVDEALAVITPAATSGSNDERARGGVGLGEALLAAGRRGDAEAAFEQAIARAPADVSMRLLIAEAWREHGGEVGDDRAVAVLEQAVTVAPDVPRVHSALGRARERVGDAAGASEAYRRALALDPSYAYVRRRLLRIAMERSDFAQAREHSARLLADEPANPEHHFLAALVASREGRTEDARRSYLAAIELEHDDYPEAYFNLGILLRSEGHLEEAIAAYQHALEHRPGYLAALNNLGTALAAAERPEEAEATLRRALDLDQHYAAAWVNLGEILVRRGAREEGIQAVRRALSERGGDHPPTELLLGSLLEADASAEAARVYEGVTTRHPRHVEAWLALGRLHLRAGRLEAAGAALGRARGVDPENVEVMRSLAELETLRGNVREAIAVYGELLDHQPGDVAGRLALAMAFAQSGDTAACERELAIVRADLPSDPRTRAARCADPAPSTD